MSVITDRVIATSSVLSVLSILFTGYQVKLTSNQVELASQQLKDDHDRSRRERAVQVLQEFPKMFDRGTRDIVYIVESLDKAQVKSLINDKSFNIDSSYKEKLIKCLELNEKALSNKSEMVHLSDEQAKQLHTKTLKFLQSLEIILIPWRHNVADRGMIEEEFGFLIENKNETLLENVRSELNGHKSYPAITEFYGVIQAKRQQDNRLKPPNPPLP